MTAKKKFPQFAHLTASDLKKLLRESMLSASDKQIATDVIAHDMEYVDVGVKHYMHRTTVSRRMRLLIAPELERIMKNPRP